MDNDDPRKWRLKRRGESTSFGPYTEEQLRGFLRDKRVAEGDLLSDGERTVRVGDLLSPSPPPPMPDRTTGARQDMGKEGAADGWSWGAFGLGLVWVIGNRVWWPGLLLLIGLVPYVGWVWNLGLAIYLGVNGHRLAREARSFRSRQHFESSMRAWNTAGLVVSIVGIVGGASTPFYMNFRAKDACLTCLANLKQLDTAMMLYARDHAERFPPHESWEETVYPYVRNESLFHCPSGTRYIYNPTVAGRWLGDFRDPARTVLLYEADSSGAPAFEAHSVAVVPRTGGSKQMAHMNIAFADGHCEAISRAEAGKYIWNFR